MHGASSKPFTVRQRLRALGVLALAAVSGSATSAYTEERSLDQMVGPPTAAHKRAQADFIAELKKRAADIAGPDTARYWAIIEAGLGQLGSIVPNSGERGARIAPLIVEPKRPRAMSPATEAEYIKAMRERLKKLEDGERIYNGTRTLPGE